MGRIDNDFNLEILVRRGLYRGAAQVPCLPSWGGHQQEVRLAPLQLWLQCRVW